MKKVSGIAVVILILVICSLFIPLNINSTGASKINSIDKLNRYVSLSRLDRFNQTELFIKGKLNPGFEFKGELGAIEGMCNGGILFGNYVRNIFVGTITDYLDGFNGKDSQMKMIWLFFGIFLEILKNVLFSSIEFIVIMLILLLQSITSYAYMLSYILTILFIIGISYVLKNN